MSDNQPVLSIKDLHVGIEGNEILHGINLDIARGEIHAIMGRNGSGRQLLQVPLWDIQTMK